MFNGICRVGVVSVGNDWRGRVENSLFSLPFYFWGLGVIELCLTTRDLIL